MVDLPFRARRRLLAREYTIRRLALTRALDNAAQFSRSAVLSARLTARVSLMFPPIALVPLAGAMMSDNP